MTRRNNTAAFKCNSCNKCTNSYCSFYKRPVDKDFNRCLHHSTYEPNTQVFKVDKNLESIMQKEEEARKAHDKIWQLEADSMLIQRKLA